MRLIDADALQRALANMWYESSISITGISVSELINNAPTIDAVEVVRCKDCKHYKPFDKSKKFDCPQGLYAVFENDYCSHGERNEE